MTTNLKSKASGNPDLDAVFDPYVTGTSPPATGFNVGGTTTDIATRYAPIVYGSAAAATGLNTEQAGHADLNTLFAAFGTASYALPINGKTYNTSAIYAAAASGALTFGFYLSSASTWLTQVSRTGTTNGTPAAGTIDSGSIPVGATQVRYTPAWLNASGDTGSATSVVNNAATATALATNVNCALNLSGNGITPHQTTYSIKIEFLNAANTVISTSTITAQLVTEGSA